MWRRDRQPWALLVLRLLLGVGVASALVVLSRTSGLSYWYEPLLVVGFLAFWWALGRRDVLAAVALVCRPQAAGDVPAGLTRRPSAGGPGGASAGECAVALATRGSPVA